MHALLEERQRRIAQLGEEGMHSYTPIVIDAHSSLSLTYLTLYVRRGQPGTSAQGHTDQEAIHQQRVRVSRVSRVACMHITHTYCGIM